MNLFPPLFQTSQGTPRDLQSLLALKTQGWGERPEVYGPGGHNGIDWGCVTGTPIYASHDGTIENITDAINNSLRLPGGFGNYVRLTNGDIKTYYGHLLKFCCVDGQSVKRGDIIAESDNTGFSSGPHLHFGVKVNNVWVDPTPYLVWDKPSSTMSEQEVRQLQALEGYSDDAGVKFWTGKSLEEYLKARLADKVKTIQASL